MAIPGGIREPITRWLSWACCALPFVLALLARPVIPVDETRYLSVAWEMWSTGSWLTPTLNGEPYLDKPPLLFWLIHAGWAVSGVNAVWPRLLPPLCLVACLVLVRELAQRLWPSHPRAAVLAPACLAGVFFVPIFATVVMFDMLLLVFVLLAWRAILDAGNARTFAQWMLFALAAAGGLMTKGPVVLVYILPVVLLAPAWREWPAAGWTRWYLSFALSFLMACLVPLAWLLCLEPGAIGRVLGEQTLARVSGELGHGRPAWWYLVVLPLVMLPFTVWKPAWRSVLEAARDNASRPLLVVLAAAFLLLSAIGGKQAHYLIPVIAGMSLLMARGLATRRSCCGWAAPAVAVLLFAGLLLVLKVLAPPHAPEWLRDIPWLPTLAATVLALVSWRARLSLPSRMLLSSGALSLLLVLSITVPARAAYDLRAVADMAHIAQASGRPVAWVENYSGELGFLGRLAAPVFEIAPAQIGQWLEHHPGGIVVVRERSLPAGVPRACHIQPYRGGRLLVIAASGLPRCPPSKGPLTP